MPWRRRNSLSLSKTWKVARLVSAISSSPRKICLALSRDGAAVGAVADAPPVMAKDTPAAPNAKAALLAVRFVARFALAIVESPGPGCPAAILGPAGAYLSCGSGCRGDTTTWVFPPSLGASLQKSERLERFERYASRQAGARRHVTASTSRFVGRGVEGAWVTAEGLRCKEQLARAKSITLRLFPESRAPKIRRLSSDSLIVAHRKLSSSR